MRVATEIPTPTDEQRAAVRVEGSAAVRAGAGCGKTTVLAERFLHLLRPRPDGGPPPVDEVGEILAITFTERAAGEMKRKIRLLLARELATATGAAGARWERVRRDMLGAQISTIHAFCARVLRENPLEAGIDPEAVVLDELESRAWLEGVVEDELVAAVRADDPAARLLVRRHRLAGGRSGGAVALVAGVLERLGTAGRDAAWLAAATAAQEARIPEVVEAMRAAAARVVATVRAELGAPGAGRKGKLSPARAALALAWPAFEAALARLGPETSPAAVQDLRRLCRLLKGARLGSKVAADLNVDGGRLRGALAEAYGFLAARPDAAGLARLFGAIAAAVGRRKRADAVLTFDDMVSETRALLGRDAAVRRRYATRFRAVLVDEFQDTDAVQADVIRLLGEGDPAPTLFVVGDEKQSIYRFRGADVAVFHQVRAALGREMPLGTNFRSLPGVLAFVNALAEATMPPPPDSDAAYWTRFDPSQRLVADRAESVPAPAVRMVSFVRELARREAGGARLQAADVRELEARALAAVVRRLAERDGLRWGEIAILFRALTQVKAYEYALRRLEVPYYVVKGRGFFQCPEVGDVLALLGALADPDDEVALAAALRSPFFAVDDDTLWQLAWPEGQERARLRRRFRRGETFDDLPAEAEALGRVRDLLLRLRRMRHRATVAELLEEAFAATDFEPVCLTQFQGRQKVANVRKLIELARDWERRRRFSLRDFVGTVRGLAAREPREAEASLVSEEDDVVRLMTVHQAKGLEFRAVLIPDLGRLPHMEYPDPEIDDRLGVLVQPVDAAGRIVFGNAALEEHRARERDREHAELARLFSVAATRAKDLLVLFEGKGDPAYLAKGGRDVRRWCHQVWDLLGRERIAAFAGGTEVEAMIELPGGGAVWVERAETYLEGSAAGIGPLPEPRTAPADDATTEAVARVLAFRPPAPAAVVTSPTALADFRRCPRQYWYRHVLALPETRGRGQEATLLGNAAHGVLEGIDFATADDAEVTRRLHARPETLALDAAARDALAADLRAAVAALRAEIAGGLEVVGREVPFVLALPAGAPRVVLDGRIDLLVRRAGTLVVRDWKYAARSAEALARYGDQLAAYRLAVAAAGTPAVESELVFLRGGPAVVPVRGSDPDAEAEAVVAAGIALGEAARGGTADDHPRRPPGPAACERLGCGWVRLCWGAAAVVSGTAPVATTRSDAS
jgi:ATP-dependent helicase/nuclease subunit A